MATGVNRDDVMSNGLLVLVSIPRTEWNPTDRSRSLSSR